MFAIIYKTDGTIQSWFNHRSEYVNKLTLQNRILEGLADETDQLMLHDSEPESDSWVDVTKNPPVMSTRKIVKSFEELKWEMLNRIQQRLDVFASSKDYDNILDASTYATSMVSDFATEGQKAVDLRDRTWEIVYKAIADYEAGLRDNLDVDSELPELLWGDEIDNS